MVFMVHRCAKPNGWPMALIRIGQVIPRTVDYVCLDEDMHRAGDLAALLHGAVQHDSAIRAAEQPTSAVKNASSD